jgi:hypothetical protein
MPFYLWGHGTNLNHLELTCYVPGAIYLVIVRLQTHDWQNNMAMTSLV